MSDALEPGQRTDQLRFPLPRRKLGRGLTLLLWALRVYVVAAVVLVGYAFIHALRTG